MNLDRIVATITLDTIVTFDTIVAFIIPFVALLTPSPVMWRKEKVWNFSVLQTVHLSNLVLLTWQNICFATAFFHYNSKLFL
jgi:hypothetical protein